MNKSRPPITGPAAESGSDDPTIARSRAEPSEVWRTTSITVIIPTYNEADNLPNAIKSVASLGLDGLSIIVVDDNSPDGTGKVADALAVEYNTAQANAGQAGRMGVLHRAAKGGLGRAYVAGMTRALDEGAEYVLQMDADGSHPYTAIPEMLKTALSTGADLVIGSRYVTGGSVDAGWPWHRKFLSAFANFYVNCILGTRIRDITSGFNLWRRSTLAALNLETIRGSAYSFQVEMKYKTIRHGGVAVEIPIHFEERTTGYSKMNLAVQLESAWRPWRLRFTHISQPEPFRGKRG